MTFHSSLNLTLIPLTEFILEKKWNSFAKIWFKHLLSDKLEPMEIKPPEGFNDKPEA